MPVVDFYMWRADPTLVCLWVSILFRPTFPLLPILVLLFFIILLFDCVCASYRLFIYFLLASENKSRIAFFNGRAFNFWHWLANISCKFVASAAASLICNGLRVVTQAWSAHQITTTNHFFATFILQARMANFWQKSSFFMISSFAHRTARYVRLIVRLVLIIIILGRFCQNSTFIASVWNKSQRLLLGLQIVFILAKICLNFLRTFANVCLRISFRLVLILLLANWVVMVFGWIFQTHYIYFQIPYVLLFYVRRFYASPIASHRLSLSFLASSFQGRFTTSSPLHVNLDHLVFWVHFNHPFLSCLECTINNEWLIWDTLFVVERYGLNWWFVVFQFHHVHKRIFCSLLQNCSQIVFNLLAYINIARCQYRLLLYLKLLLIQRWLVSRWVILERIGLVGFSVETALLIAS